MCRRPQTTCGGSSVSSLGGNAAIVEFGPIRAGLEAEGRPSDFHCASGQLNIIVSAKTRSVGGGRPESRGQEGILTAGESTYLAIRDRVRLLTYAIR